MQQSRENGAGKSNFLEALVLFGAAEADKLDNEFLVSRGVRAVEYARMLSSFNNEITHIIINLKTKTVSTTYEIQQSINPFQTFDTTCKISILNKDFKNQIISQIDQRKIIIKDLQKAMEESNEKNEILLKGINIFNPLYALKTKYRDTKEEIQILEKYIDQKFEELKDSRIKFKNKTELDTSKFLLYSPENTALRNFYREGQIEPLGINGEGLLKLLKVMQESEAAAFQDVLICLELFDWFEQIDVPKDLTSFEDKVTIKDKYLHTIFDQRSANEGFLFVLFYAALFCSQYTPKIFAIDNIDASFNPKLCTAIIKKLVELAKKYDKQVFVTTHNPAILDGIDLGDAEQKILVASRNKQGHTRFKALTLADKPKSSTGEPIRLSEAFLRGYIGGLPKNF